MKQNKPTFVDHSNYPVRQGTSVALYILGFFTVMFGIAFILDYFFG